MLKIEKLYRWLLILALFGGLLVFLFDFLGILIGNETGECLINIAQNKIMKISSIITTLTILTGILYLYLAKEHSLKVN